MILRLKVKFVISSSLDAPDLVHSLTLLPHVTVSSHWTSSLIKPNIRRSCWEPRLEVWSSPSPICHECPFLTCWRPLTLTRSAGKLGWPSSFYYSEEAHERRTLGLVLRSVLSWGQEPSFPIINFRTYAESATREWTVCTCEGYLHQTKQSHWNGFIFADQ